MFSKVENMWPFWEFTDAATALDGTHTDCSLVVWLKNKHCRFSFLIICNDFMNPGKKKGDDQYNLHWGGVGWGGNI